MLSLTCLSPEKLAILSLIIALLISKGEDADDLNVIGNFIVAIGGIMLTIAAQEQNLQAKKEKRKADDDLTIYQQIQHLKKGVDMINKQLGLKYS
ncbi:MAG: hypothetical protein ACOX5W_00705 [Bacillota bacterium]|jgi:hypothetical protein